MNGNATHTGVDANREVIMRLSDSDKLDAILTRMDMLTQDTLPDELFDSPTLYPGQWQMYIQSSFFYIRTQMNSARTYFELEIVSGEGSRIWFKRFTREKIAKEA